MSEHLSQPTRRATRDRPVMTMSLRRAIQCSITNSSFIRIATATSAINLLKSRGTTFVIMTHRIGILAVADKVLILHEGVSRAFGPRDEVLAALTKGAAEAQQASQASQARRPALTAAA